MSKKGSSKKNSAASSKSIAAKPAASGASRERLVVIDMMVGLAMVLVVLGHMSVGFEPRWYSEGLHLWIYTFHMEMFVFLSAFLIRYTYKGVHSLLEYGQYIWRKFKKFFLWFLIIGMAVSLLACVVKGYDCNGRYLWESLKTMLVYPRHSEAAFLWYIYVLFGFYIISPLFFKPPQWVRVLLCVGALLLTMVNGSTLLCSHEFCQYTFFYCLGVLCAEWIEEIKGVKGWMWGMLAVPFVAYSVWLFSEGYQMHVQMWQMGWWTTVTGVAALPFFYVIGKLLGRIGVVRNVLTNISMSCYWIYLLQMFVIWGAARLVAGQMPFGLFMALTTIAALVLPWALWKIWQIVKTRKKRDSYHSRPAKNTSLK